MRRKILPVAWAVIAAASLGLKATQPDLSDYLVVNAIRVEVVDGRPRVVPDVVARKNFQGRYKTDISDVATGRREYTPRWSIWLPYTAGKKYRKHENMGWWTDQKIDLHPGIYVLETCYQAQAPFGRLASDCFTSNDFTIAEETEK